MCWTGRSCSEAYPNTEQHEKSLVNEQAITRAHIVYTSVCVHTHSVTVHTPTCVCVYICVCLMHRYLFQVGVTLVPSPSRRAGRQGSRLQPSARDANAKPGTRCDSPHPVRRAVCLGAFHLHHDVGVQEVGGDHVWDKWRVLFLEDDCHDVIANVPLPLELSGKGNIWSAKPGSSAPAGARVSAGCHAPRPRGAAASQPRMPRRRAAQHRHIPAPRLPRKEAHPPYLLCVSFGERQLCRDVKHYLPVPEHRVHRLGSRLPVADIQPSSKTRDEGKGGEK